MDFRNWMSSLASRTRALAALCALAVFCAAGSAAADSPVLLGDVGLNGTDSGQGCTAFGWNSASTHPYTIPYDGILTRFTFTTGTNHAVDVGETSRLRTVHATSATAGFVASESAPFATDSLPNSQTTGFNVHVPAAAGDRLAITTAAGSGGYLGQTHCTTDAFASEGSADTGYYVGSAPTNSSVTWTSTTGRLPNVRAALEPDADHDGFGDGSQDLCPTIAAFHDTACSGVLFGVNTALATAGSNIQCLFTCVRVQTAIGGISTAAPFNGVVVRWRAASNIATTMSARIVRPTDSTNFQLVRSSDPASIGATISESPGGPFPPTMTTVPSRIPISKGDFVGLGMSTAPATFYSTEIPGSLYLDLNGQPDGASVGKPSASGGMIFYNADIEPDADGDGYGDDTQDLCSTDAATHGPCPSTDDVTAPVISGFKVSPKTFKVAAKGAVISKKVPAGTKFKLKSSEAAGVTFTIYRVAGKKLRKVHAFIRAAKAKSNSFAYSGRYRVKKKTLKLSAGSYKVTAIAVDLAGNHSIKRTASFKIAR
jgi:hypothetical protein